MFALFSSVLLLRGGVVPQGVGEEVRVLDEKDALEQGLRIGTGFTEIRSGNPKI